MIVTTAKIIHSTLLKIILAISLLFAIIAFLLLHGFTLDKILLPGVKIEKLYIKLDKKLIVKIASIQTKPSPVQTNSLKELDIVTNIVPLLPTIFHKIEIQDIQIGDEKAKLLYVDNLFHITSKHLRLITTLTYDEQGKALHSDIEELFLIDPGIKVEGVFTYDLPTHTWNAQGAYRGLALSGHFICSREKRKFHFKIDSNTTHTIEPLIDYLNPPKNIKVWINPNIPAQKYRLNILEGTLLFDRQNRIDLRNSKIVANATAWQAKIHFHPHLPAVAVDRIDITFADDTLFFKLHHPLYQGKNLEGSYVRIRNILAHKNPTLDAHIVLNDRFDKKIQKLLRTYNIHVPFIQTEGKMSTHTDLSVRLDDGKITHYKGEYRAKYALLLFDDTVGIPVKNLHVIAKERLFRIKPCQILIRPYLDATLEGTLDLKKKIGYFKPIVHSLVYDLNGLMLFSLKERVVPITLRFADFVDFTIPLFSARLRYQSGGKMRLTFESLHRLHPYMLGPLKPLKKGRIDLLRTKKQEILEANVVYDLPILLQHHRPVTHFHIRASHNEKNLTLFINNRIKILQKKNLTQINYQDYDIDLTKLKKQFEPIFKGSKKEPTTSSFIHITARKSTLYTDFASLSCDNYHLKITRGTHGSAFFESKHASGTIRGVFYDHRMKIVGKNLPDSVVHGISALRDFYGGYFDFEAAGKIDDFNGTIYAYDTLWAKSPLYNNILATLNTIPAILTLKNPGFSHRGFKIKYATMLYRYRKPRLTFKQIAIHGESADIYGSGSIDFKTDRIEAGMRIRFMESISSILHKIPIAGYLLLGKQGTLSIGLKVSGSLENPKVTTTAPQDIVVAPINILKRTLTFPFTLFK